MCEFLGPAIGHDQIRINLAFCTHQMSSQTTGHANLHVGMMSHNMTFSQKGLLCMRTA